MATLSNSYERGTKHVSAVLEIFDSQTKKMKKSQTALKTEPYLCVVTIIIIISINSIFTSFIFSFI